MITSVLVANRGEIARRVLRSCRDLGLATVAVYSDADAAAPHVTEADVAVHLPGYAPVDTYLRTDLIVAAARQAGADAVHPGYGFGSENAAFARAVVTAGLTWIGPSPEAMDAMGRKVEAKRLMSAAGVPVLPELLPDAITGADLPVLIKASAGGGGRGLRIVRDLADLPREVELARAEAASAFGDPTVFCEPYLATGHHVEVQIMADNHGTVWTVGERECSIQRRHQKVVEEAPSPLVERSDGLRERLFAAARTAAGAIAYTGAGTVEFLADDAGRFFFLEMNTRLQVEHPVTECTTGLDLVALQLEVADGAHLSAESPTPQGHCIEVRLYAEDPAAGWQPQSGTIGCFDVPGVSVEFAVGTLAAGLRLDCGVRAGSVVGVHYDSMLAKLISWAPTRPQAARALAAALAASRIHGLVTNRDLLVNVLRHPAFFAGETDTAFIDRHGLDALAAPLVVAADEPVHALAAALALDAAAREAAPVLPGIPSGWRNVVSQPQRTAFDAPTGRLVVSHRLTRAGLVADGFEHVALLRSSADEVVLAVDGVRRTFTVARYGPDVYVDSAAGAVHLVAIERFTDPADQVAPGSLRAPMPGTVVRLGAAVGDRLTAGQPILWLEAMKMQHPVTAPVDGVLTELLVHESQSVEVGAVLAVVRSGDPADSNPADPAEETPLVNFTETAEQQALRTAVAALGQRYGPDYTAPRARAREPLTELWAEAGRSGFIGLNLPEEYGGGGAGLTELAIVGEELNAAGCGLLMMVVSPAINGTIIARYGTDAQKRRWLPGIADGSTIMAFAITEPDAGSNSHRITTTARKDGDEWVLNGRKIYVSGVDHADAVLIVARMEDARTGRLKPALFTLPTATPGFEFRAIDMDVVMPDRQFLLFLDDVRLPADALIGDEDAALAQLFAGLNPERIMAAAGSVGMGRFALDKAVAYANERAVWGQPIGAHQGIAHPLAQAKVELELAKLMMQKAAALYDDGDEMGAGEAANMAKYAAAEASIAAVDQAVQTHGGNGLAHEYGLGNLVLAARVARIAPVSREMILNFVAQFSLGLPKSY